MARLWKQVSPEARKRHYRRNSARARALSRLRMRHPDEFRVLFEEELAEGPIYGGVHRLPTDAVLPESDRPARLAA